MPKLGELAVAAQALEPASELKPLAPDTGAPFRVLILGDFSARNHRAVFEPADLAWRMPTPVHPDILDAALGRLLPTLSLPIPNLRRRAELTFSSMSDFLPGHVAATIAPLGVRADELPSAVRYLMHHPDFQAVEAAWRGLAFLADRAGTGANVRILLLDVSKQELADDLCSVGDLCDSGLYRVMVRHSGMRAAHPWGLCAGNYSFTPYVEDLEMLMRLAGVARHSGTPFLGAVKPDWPSHGGLSWQMLRESPEAAYVGLSTPRFLVRLPHKLKEGDGWQFDEMPDEPVLENYLWANPAFVCAAVLIEGFREQSWRWSPDSEMRIAGLQSHFFGTEEAPQRKLPAEFEFDQVDLERLRDRGVTPLIAEPDGNRIRLPFIQSIRKPETPLRGRWM